MFVDAWTLDDGQEFAADVCIVGAGAAGIAMARAFKDSPLDVCLVESGGLHFDGETQALFQAENVGHSYYELIDARLRFFGGTTNHWGGHCRPLEEIDFEPRPWVPNSGWPLSLRDLQHYYARATEVVQIGPHERFSLDDWDEAEASYENYLAYTLPNTGLRPALWQLSPPTRFGEVYGDELERAERVKVLLNANLVAYDGAETGGRVERVSLHFSPVLRQGR